MLCELYKLKLWLGITDNSKDEILQMIIDAKSNEIERYCDTKLNETIILNERHVGADNTNKIVLNNRHIQYIKKVSFVYDDNVTVIYDRDNNIDLYNLEIVNDQTIKFNTLIPSYTLVDSLTELKKYNVYNTNISVDYVCGFSIIPNDLAYACLTLCGRDYTQKVGGGLQVASEGIQSLKVTYDTKHTSNPLDATMSELSIINKYKKVV